MIHDEHLIQRPFAVITGASDGFGRELATQFASKGFDLIICGKEENIDSIRHELLTFGNIVEAHALDLSTFKGVEALLSAVEAFGHPVDAFAFHSEPGHRGPYLDTALKDEFMTLRENVFAPVHILKRVLKDMVARGHGKVLITSSDGPSIEAPFEAVYGATKAFLFSLSEALRTEIRNEGVTLTTLLPNLYDLPSESELAIIDDPEELAVECFEAMMSGRDYVFHATLRSKLQGMLSRLLPDRARAFLTSPPS